MSKAVVVAVCVAILVGAAAAMSGYTAPAAGLVAAILVVCFRGAGLKRKRNE